MVLNQQTAGKVLKPFKAMINTFKLSIRARDQADFPKDVAKSQVLPHMPLKAGGEEREKNHRTHLDSKKELKIQRTRTSDSFKSMTADLINM